MSKKLVYLAGPITGLSYDGAVNWRESFADDLVPYVECMSPMRAKRYLKEDTGISGKPDAYSHHPLSTDKAIITRDRNDVKECDMVVANLLGAERVSIGTVVEFGWADAFRKPIVLIIEKEKINPHEHAFIYGLAGFVVHSIEEARMVVKAVLLP